MTDIQQKFKYAVIIAAIITRGYMLITREGFMHPDSIYQSLEQSHRIVFGYGLIPWEFIYGIRSWLLPIGYAALFKIGIALSIKDIMNLVFICRFFSTVFSLILLYVTYMVAKEIFNKKIAIYSAFFATFTGFLIAWTNDTSTVVISTTYVLICLYYISKGLKNPVSSNYTLAGLALGIAFMLRFDTMLFAIPFTAIILYQKEYKGILYLTIGLVIMILLQGTLDYFTWGSFLHSPIAFIDHNLIQKKSALFGTLPFYYYIVMLAINIGHILVIPYSIEKKQGFALIAIPATFFFLSFSLIPHKELRFMIPILPFLSILAGKGLEKLEKTDKILAIGMVAFTLFFGLVSTPNAFGGGHEENIQALTFIRERDDVTGMAYVVPYFNSGLYTFLHKRIPVAALNTQSMSPMLNMIECGKPDLDLIGYQCTPLDEMVDEKTFNYVMTENMILEEELMENGFEKMAQFGLTSVYKRVD